MAYWFPKSTDQSLNNIWGRGLFFSTHMSSDIGELACNQARKSLACCCHSWFSLLMVQAGKNTWLSQLWFVIMFPSLGMEIKKLSGVPCEERWDDLEEPVLSRTLEAKVTTITKGPDYKQQRGSQSKWAASFQKLDYPRVSPPFPKQIPNFWW